MKRLLASAIAVAFTAGAALGADLPSRKAEPLLPTPPPTPMWTGFYTGLNAGGTWGNSPSITDTGFPIYAQPNASVTTIPVAMGVAAGLSGTRNLQTSGGFIGGGQVGYNIQYGRALVGLEADFQGIAGGEQNGSLARSYTFDFFSLGRTNRVVNNVRTRISGQKALDYIGTARAKIGFLVTPDILIYGTGGLAYGGATLRSTTIIDEIAELTDEVGVGSSSKSSLLTGWTAGGGVEWMFAQNWSAKAEYLYYDLGRMQMYGGAAILVRNNIGPVGAGTPRGQIGSIAGQNVSAHFNGNIIRAGVNYHFNWGSAAPIVAKY
jgi:outer membrane immunogenic protein